MAERVLRDHSQSCKHAPDGYKKVWGDGFHIGHEYQWAPAHHAWCPGGREVTIDYEAAGSMLAELRRVHVVMVDADHSARRIIGAALGEDDPSSVAALGV